MAACLDASVEHACCCQCHLAIGVSPIELKLTEDAVNELGLCQVDVPLAVLFDVDPKKVDDHPFDCDLESGSLHVLHHLQWLSLLWGSEKESLV